MKTIPQRAIACRCVSEAERSYRILADQIAEGDIIIHCNSRILVATEPQYTYRGIVFDAIWLDIDSPDNMQQIYFDPASKLDLVATASVFNAHLAA